MNRQYLRQWIDANYESLCGTEWYEENFDGETMEDIETDFFIETYLIPLIESNISWDFGRTIDASALLSDTEIKDVAVYGLRKAMQEHCDQETLVAEELGVSVGTLRFLKLSL